MVSLTLMLYYAENQHGISKKVWNVKEDCAIITSVTGMMKLPTGIVCGNRGIKIEWDGTKKNIFLLA
jgi:hypothetical protein